MRKLPSIKYTIYRGTKFINFVYTFCVPTSNNLSGDQDDVTTMEEEILENENNTENDFNSNIAGSHLNSTNETINNYRMFLNYRVFSGNSLIKIKCNLEKFFSRNRTNLFSF